METKRQQKISKLLMKELSEIFQREIKSNGIFRRIDQICFFNRVDKENKIVVFMKDGKYTGKKIPNYALKKFIDNKETELIKLLNKANLIEESYEKE